MISFDEAALLLSAWEERPLRISFTGERTRLGALCMIAGIAETLIVFNLGIGNSVEFDIVGCSVDFVDKPKIRANEHDESALFITGKEFSLSIYLIAVSDAA